RDFSYAYFVSPLRYRTPDKQCGPGRYRGLTAFASLSMAVSAGLFPGRSSARRQILAAGRAHRCRVRRPPPGLHLSAALCL
ncbi:hypothetical protein, partial [Thiolapillus sp.]|uniref:hypothetical protein n=1 Tax=Thiolapillus sp. TaxID=2017437 RepID=UPI003AF82C22